MFLTGSNSIVAGSAENFTLDRDQLAALMTDAYFQEKEFWREVLVTYRFSGKTNDQRVLLQFKEKQDITPFAISARAKEGTWQLESVTAIDFDHGSETVLAADIPNINLYDVTVTSV